MAHRWLPAAAIPAAAAAVAFKLEGVTICFFTTWQTRLLQKIINTPSCIKRQSIASGSQINIIIAKAVCRCSSLKP